MPPTPGAPTPNLDVTGQAPIAAGDRVRARERALDDAFRQAVDQAAAALLGPQELAERISLLKLTVEPKARSYVASYRVLEEGEQSGTFHVHLAALLDLDRLERDLTPRPARRGTRAPTPRAVVCLAARDDLAAAPAWTATPDADLIAGAITAAGAVVAPMPAGCAPEGTSTEPTDARAAEAARAALAQGTIVGAVIASPAGPIRGTRFVGAHAVAELHIVDPEGRVVASARAEHDGWGLPGAASAAATRPAVERALASLAPAIAKKWSREGQAGVTLRAEGVSTWADLQLLQRGAAALPGVAGVEPRRFSLEGTELLVRGEVNAPDLAAALARGADAGRLRVRSRGDRELEVEILPPPPPPPPPLFPAPPPPAITLPASPPVPR